MKILYIGQLFKGSTALHRANAITRLGFKLTRIDATQNQDLFSRAVNKFYKNLQGYLLEDHSFNKKILQILSAESFDLLWVDKGLRIAPDIVRYFKLKNPESPAIHYSPDDMMNPSNQTVHYLKSIPIYDLHVTTKSYNVDEIKGLGAQDVIMVDNAFEPEIHRPVHFNPGELEYYSARVGFIGAYETERANMIQEIAVSGIHVKVWGKSWRKFQGKIKNLEIMPVDMLEEQYARVLNATAINLCFLRKVNRDLQTTRTMEIPACGGFMLAERTDEHLRLFHEGIEADFFSNTKELIEKVEYYLVNDVLRRQISTAGYQRCLTSGYSNDARMAQVFQYLKLPVETLKQHSI